VSDHRPTGRVPSVFDVAFLTGVEDVTTLVLVRHGQQDVADYGRGAVGDLIDPPLSEIGRRQAELVGKRFAEGPVDVVYASNLRRAYDTGMEVARHHLLAPIVLEDLREVEIFRDIPPEQSAVDFIGRDLMLGVRERMIAERRWDVYPYSESSFDFRKRTVNAIEAIAAGHRGQRVVIACHAGVVNAYIGHAIGVAEDMFFRPAHTAVNVVLVGAHGARALQSLGDVHHLTEVDATLVTY
jgi:2,3-bisphosphoglycerate-dependent phosphoglycerate mutase